MTKSTGVSRREFLGGMAATSAAAAWFAPAVAAEEHMPLLKPRAVRKGDVIGLVAPASPVFEPSEIIEGQRAMEKLGFRVKLGKHIGKKWGYLAGSDQERAEDLMSMFTDPEVAGIVALRGGYGAIRILPYLDYKVIRQNPKILIGYSDITTLHLAIHKLSGIVTYHGAVALSTFNAYSTRYFMDTLTKAAPPGVVETPAAALPMTFWPEQSPAVVKGPLTGGNLTLVTATLGTPYDIDTAGKILFLEEVGEEPYSLDRMFTQLQQAGKLAAAAAILVDRCVKCKPAEYKPAFDNTLSVEEIIQDRLSGLGVPVLYGLQIGHVADKPVLPLGIEAIVDRDNARFAVTESAVREI